jgi:hypothetical protein
MPSQDIIGPVKPAKLMPNYVRGVPPPHDHKMSHAERMTYFGKPIVVVPAPAENAKPE